MEEISVKDKKYVKAKVLARELGYTTDYVGQLCRGGKVDAQLVGRTWYVDPDSIKDHKENRYRSSKASTARTLHAEVVKHVRSAASSQEHFYSHRARPTPNYESDEADLLPQPKKDRKPVDLPVELADAEEVRVKGFSNQEYHFTAPKREETKFFGTLKVTEFMTEVPVGGEEEKAKKVPVSANLEQGDRDSGVEAHKQHGMKRFEVKKHEDEHKAETEHHEPKIPDSETVHQVTLHRLTHRDPRPVKDSFAPKLHVALPISGEEGEVVSLPVTYHLITLTSVVSALVIAAVVIGLETTVTATAQQITTDFSFAIHDIAALLYAVK